MAGTVVVDTVKGSTIAPPMFQRSDGTAIGELCTAWVNFNGTGTVVIRDDFNVSSITDNGVGDYTVNFETALADANYAFVVSCREDSSSGASDATAQFPFTSNPTTTALRGRTTNETFNAVDAAWVSVAIFGGR